jgi:glycosyltransferase involved in cell wall biosynthesis
MPGAGGLPSVSIVMPTWKRVAFLREALESIRAQHLEDWELIVADDGSGPELRAAVAMLAHDDPRVRLLPLEHSGNPPAVRNAARARARGELIAFIDSDDVWLPEKLHLQVRALQARPESGWSYTGFTLIDSKGNALQRHGLSAFGAADPGSRQALFASLLQGKARCSATVCLPLARLIQARGRLFSHRSSKARLWLRNPAS